ncbi:hypothetical protein Krac_2569 [Ktedonobacter racemifer DSM 44963]|uniref:Uncharacterized protein n=1 Tax=Ktedonobacter racemifer DSM 44963 TaxID=485913 RepID=D6TZ27_KTERA|nr:hypothetical protein Krac_2569 [Ktedonobacter racemifer DSM 44963]
MALLNVRLYNSTSPGFVEEHSTEYIQATSERYMFLTEMRHAAEVIQMYLAKLRYIIGDIHSSQSIYRTSDQDLGILVRNKGSRK